MSGDVPLSVPLTECRCACLFSHEECGWRTMCHRDRAWQGRLSTASRAGMHKTASGLFSRAGRAKRKALFPRRACGLSMPHILQCKECPCASSCLAFHASWGPVQSLHFSAVPCMSGRLPFNTTGTSLDPAGVRPEKREAAA